MHTVDCIRRAKLGLEQSLDLFVVGQVGFASDDMFCALGCFGLDNIGQDEVDVGCLGVRQKFRCELQDVSGKDKDLGKGEDRRGTDDTAEPSTGTGDQDDVLGHVA